MNMPTSLKWAIGLIVAELVIAISIIAAAIISVSYKATSGFWMGFQRQIAAAARAPSIERFGPDQAAYYSGIVSFSIILLVIAVVGIVTRKFWIAYMPVILLLLASIASKSFPLIPIIVFILICSPSSQIFFKRHKLTFTSNEPAP